MTVTCINDECAEQGIAKPLTLALGPDEIVFCGTCGEPCAMEGGTDD